MRQLRLCSSWHQRGRAPAPCCARQRHRCAGAAQFCLLARHSLFSRGAAASRAYAPAPRAAHASAALCACARAMSFVNGLVRSARASRHSSVVVGCSLNIKTLTCCTHAHRAPRLLPLFCSRILYLSLVPLSRIWDKEGAAAYTRTPLRRTHHCTAAHHGTSCTHTSARHCRLHSALPHRCAPALHASCCRTALRTRITHLFAWSVRRRSLVRLKHSASRGTAILLFCCAPAPLLLLRRAALAAHSARLLRLALTCRIRF